MHSLKKTKETTRKRYSLHVVGPLLHTKDAVQIVPTPPALKNGDPISRFLGKSAMRPSCMVGVSVPCGRAADTIE